MATVNRYTNISIPRYTPRTLQEMMMVPAYKRQQHDTINQSIAELETQLAQYDSLDVHDQRLAEEQKLLYDKLNKQASLLDQEGFSQSSKTNFLRFNKEYQSAVGPQGNIGKIQSAKASYEKEKAELMANAVKMNYGPEDVKAKLKEKYQQYGTEFLATGEIKDFEAPLPPAYENLQTDIVEIGKAMGYKERQWLVNGEATIEPDASGMLKVKSVTGSQLSRKNLEQIQDSIDYLNEKWLRDGAPGARSAGWQNMSKEYITNAIKEGMSLQKVDSFRDMRQEDFDYKKGPDTAEPNPYKLAVTGGKQANPRLADNNYEQIQNEVKELEAKGENLTEVERSQLSEAQNFLGSVDAILEQNPSYTNLQTYIPKLEEKYYKVFEDPDAYLKNNTEYQKILKEEQEDANVGPLENRRSTRYKRDLLQRMKSEIYEAREEVEDIRQGVIESKRLLETTYTLLPQGSQARGDFKGFSSNLQLLGFTSPKEFAQAANFEGVVLGNGYKRDLSEGDKEALSRLMFSAKQDGLQFVNVTPSALNGLPGYTVRIPKDKLTESYDFDGWSYSNDDVGPGDSDEMLQVSFTFTDPTSKGVRNINTYVMEELNKSDDGPEVVYEMGKQLMKKQYEGNTWQSLFDGGHMADNEMLNEIYLETLYNFGLRDDMTDAEKVERIKKVRNTNVYAY